MRRLRANIDAAKARIGLVVDAARIHCTGAIRRRYQQVVDWSFGSRY